MRKFLLFCVLSLVSTFAQSEVERHALVIGNSNYSELALVNPVNDAEDMAAQLSKLGYKIHGGGPALDLDRLGMQRTIRAFAQQLPEEAHALFYYAGHGMATNSENYLIPVRHGLEFQEQIPDRSVSLRSVVDVMKSANPRGINVVLLDACRDNPLGRSARGGRAGLERLIDIPRGVFIGYAADTGQVYTGELLSVMREKPNVIIELAHKEVANRVVERTSGKQFPVSENRVYGNWCFGECVTPIASSSGIIPKEPVSQPVATDTSAVVPAPKRRSSMPTWKVVGGVVLGAVLVGLAAGSSGGGGSGSETPPQLPLLEIIPP